MSVNQGKLEVVKQEMVRVNMDILGISELKWTGMDKFNSDDHSICGQESLRRSRVAIIVNKSPTCSAWGQSPGKTGGWEQLSFFFFFNFILFLNFTILYWFCQISKWICHRYTCVPHPEPSSLLPPHTIPLGRPSAPAPSIQYRAWNLDWQLVSYMIWERVGRFGRMALKHSPALLKDVRISSPAYRQLPCLQAAWLCFENIYTQGFGVLLLTAGLFGHFPQLLLAVLWITTLPTGRISAE